MKIETKLTLIKIIHTAVWIFFNFVIFYMLYAAIANKLDLWLWIGYGFVLLEGLTFLLAVLILMVNFQLDVSAKVRCTRASRPKACIFTAGGTPDKNHHQIVQRRVLRYPQPEPTGF
jgi:hypothetical protein